MAAIEDTPVVHPRHAARLVREHLPLTPFLSVRLSTSGSSVGCINHNAAADDARDAGAELHIFGLLRIAEEYIAVVDNPVDLQNREGAQATFAPPAIEDHRSEERRV